MTRGAAADVYRGWIGRNFLVFHRGNVHSGLVSFPSFANRPRASTTVVRYFQLISSTSPQLSFLLRPLVERRARAPPAPLHAPKHRHAQQHHRARGGSSSKDMMMRTQQPSSSRRASSSYLSRMLLRKAFPIAAVLLLVSVLINIRYTTSLMMMSTITRRDLLALSSSSAEHRRMMATRTNLHARTNQNAMPTSVELPPRRIHGENNSQSFHSRAYATLLTTAHGKSTLKYMTSSLQRDATPGARLHKRLRS